MWTNTKVGVVDAYITIAGLTPGRCMQVIVNAYLDSTRLSTKAFWRNDYVRVTCGCPTANLYELPSTESTGTPASFTISQVFLLFFSFCGKLVDELPSL